MLKNRIAYLTILLCAAVFYVFYDGYLSHYVLLLALILPVLSLLLSLPGALGAEASLTFGVTAARKGRELPLTITAKNKYPVVSGRVRLTLTVHNTMTGETQQERFAFTAGPRPTAIVHDLISPHCGKVELTLSKARVYDYLGLFSMPLRLAGPAEQSLLFYPAVSQPALTVEPRPLSGGEGERYSQTKPGDDPSELFAFREYREGDRISQIHWKLSPKNDALMVRELGLPISCHLLFLLEIGGLGCDADALLDLFATLSAFLAEQEAPHRVCFRSGVDGTLTYLDILTPEDAMPALATLLTAGAAAPATPLRAEELPDDGASHVMYLCREPSRQTLDALSSRLSGAKLSVFTVCEPDADLDALKGDLPVGADLIPVAPGLIGEALSGFQM